jgi:hypothetical protein
VSRLNACLTPKGRLLLGRRVVDQGWNLRRAAESVSCSPATAKKWADRCLAFGEAGMTELSSRPLHSPSKTPALQPPSGPRAAVHPAAGEGPAKLG